MLIEMWGRGAAESQGSGTCVGRGIVFVSRCWERIAEEHGDMATLILSVLSRQSWFGDGAGSTRIVSAFSLSLEVYVNLILSLMGGTLRYGLGCIVHFTLSQNPQDKASISSLILQPLSWPPFASYPQSSGFCLGCPRVM